MILDASTKQNWCTEGCSKLKWSVDMTGSEMNNLNINVKYKRTDALSLWHQQ